MNIDKTTAKIVGRFVQHCVDELGLRSYGPKTITINLIGRQTGMPTAGYVDPKEGKIVVAVNNRAIADVLRTVAHELTHVRQAMMGTVFPENDKDLQPLEDEANVMSGRLVRFYGRAHKEIYSDLSM